MYCQRYLTLCGCTTQAQRVNVDRIRRVYVQQDARQMHLVFFFLNDPPPPYTPPLPPPPPLPLSSPPRHSARHSGPGGPPPGTKKVGSQLRVERRQAEVQPSVPPVKPSVAQVRPPRSVPSHSSRPLITPLPQNEQRLASK